MDSVMGRATVRVTGRAEADIPHPQEPLLNRKRPEAVPRAARVPAASARVVSPAIRTAARMAAKADLHKAARRKAIAAIPTTAAIRRVGEAGNGTIGEAGASARSVAAAWASARVVPGADSSRADKAGAAAISRLRAAGISG